MASRHATGFVFDGFLHRRLPPRPAPCLCALAAARSLAAVRDTGMRQRFGWNDAAKR